MKPCGHPLSHEPACRVCYLYETDPAYRQLWKGSTLDASLPPRNAACLALGEVLDKLDCSCPARWLRGCRIHQVCTLDGCKTCPDYIPLE